MFGSKIGLLFLFFLSAHFPILAQKNIKIYTEEDNNLIKLYADNMEYSPISMDLVLDLDNFKAADGENQSFTLPARSTKFLLTELEIADRRKASKFSYKFKTWFGPKELIDENPDFEYSLPFEPGKSFILSQGYNGKLSHKGQNELDFTMPIGTIVTAIRNGVVIDFVESNDRGCPTEDCKKLNNYILVYQSDGTLAEYVHLKKNGVDVEIGDEIEQGQAIGLSGNTGYSSGPHLHISVFQFREGRKVTFPTKFKVAKEDQAIFLEEGNFYEK